MPQPKRNATQDLIDRNAQILGTGVDHVRRRIYLFNDVDESSMFRTVVGLHLMDTQPGDIQIHLNSNGGMINVGFALFDAIKDTKNKVVIIGSGAIFSMASILMQAGDVRLLTPNSRMMIHTGTSGVPEDHDTDRVITYGEELRAGREHLIDILVERSKSPRRVIRRLMLRESWFSPTEAVDLGLVDGILSPSPKE